MHRPHPAEEFANLGFLDRAIELQKVDLVVRQEEDAAIVGLTADAAAKDQVGQLGPNNQFDGEVHAADACRQDERIVLSFGNDAEQLNSIVVLHNAIGRETAMPVRSMLPLV